MHENQTSTPADVTMRVPRPMPPAPADVTLRMPHPFPPAYAGPRPIRPRLVWIFLSWALFVVLVVAGVGGFAGGLFSTLATPRPPRSSPAGSR